MSANEQDPTPTSDDAIEHLAGEQLSAEQEEAVKGGLRKVSEAKRDSAKDTESGPLGRIAVN